MSGKSKSLHGIENLLSPSFPKKHVTALLGHFATMVHEFQKGEWENTIAKSGKFIEAVLKALFVGAGQTLPGGRAFKADLVINGLAQLPATVHDSIRLTIPRASRFVYDVASNRGGRHDPDEIDPNEMDANSAVTTCSWILGEMVRVAQKGAVNTAQAKAIVETLAEKRYPNLENVDGRLYFHLRKKSAVDVALLALAYRYPKRMSKQELFETVKRNGFKEKNAKVAVQRIAKLVDDDGTGQFRLLAPGLKAAEELMKNDAGK
jgi:hypothetical protein